MVADVAVINNVSKMKTFGGNSAMSPGACRRLCSCIHGRSQETVFYADRAGVVFDVYIYDTGYRSVRGDNVMSCRS